MLAGRLLAESGQVEEVAARQVVDQLFDIALGNARHGGYADVYQRYMYPLRRLGDRFRGTSDALEVISLLTGNAYVVSRARRIADSTELDFLLRLFAIAVLNNVSTDRDEAQQRLRSISPSAASFVDHYLIALWLIDFVSKQSDEARAILLRLVSDFDADVASLADVASMLIDLGEVPAAVTAARRVVEDVRANQEELRAAAKLLLEQADPEERSAVAHELAGLFSERRSQEQVEVAQELMDAGFPDEALHLARIVITTPTARSEDLSTACGIWLSISGRDRHPELLAMLGERPVLEDTEHVGIAEALAKAGCLTEARRLVDEVLGDTTAEGYATGAAIKLWFALTESSSPDDLLGLMAGRRTMDSWVRAETADALATTGHLAAAVDFAHAALSDPRADAYDVRTSADVCLQAGSALPEVQALIEQGRPLTPRGRMIAARALAQLQSAERATQLALEVLNDAHAGQALLQDAIDIIVLAKGAAAAEPVLAALQFRSQAHALRAFAADKLATEGALTAAVDLWCDMLVHTPVSPADSVDILNQLVQTGHRDRAVATLRDALAVSDMHPARQVRLKSLLAWGTLCGGPTDATISEPPSI